MSLSGDVDNNFCAVVSFYIDMWVLSMSIFKSVPPDSPEKRGRVYFSFVENKSPPIFFAILWV
jgi:hypothetical protein